MDDSRLQSQIVGTAVESGKSMGSAMKNEGKEEGLAELFKLNQVWYRMPPTLSLVSKRTITRCNFQQLSYIAPLNQQIASAIFNTGEFQVSGKTSYLCIQAGIDKSSTALQAIFNTANQTTANTQARARSLAHAYLGQGGIMNIIEEATFLSASGTEVDRQQNKGLQQSHVTRNRQNLNWYNTIGESQGYPGGSFQDCYDGRGWAGAVQNTVNGQIIAPWLIPSRATHTTDYSSQYIDASQTPGVLNTGTTPSTTYDSTKFSDALAAQVGSVDLSFDPTYNATFNPKVGVAPTFIIPLCDVLGMFGPYMNALVPSQSLAGGRLELRFKDMSEALVATGPSLSAPTQPLDAEIFNSDVATANARTFLNQLQIYNIYFLLDSFQLNEGTLSRLNEAAAGNEGLSLMFDTWDWTQTPFSSNSGEAQVSQARSRIIRSFCVLRDQAARTNPWANSLASEAAVNRPWAATKRYQLTAPVAGPPAQGYQLLVNRYQAQMGSLYFPQQPLTSLEEYVMNSYYTWSRSYVDPMETNSVSLSDFIGANGNDMYTNGAPKAPIADSLYATANAVTKVVNVTAGGAAPSWNAYRTFQIEPPIWCMNWGSATYGFLAERSQLLQLSGLPISNARLLRHSFVLNYGPASGTTRLVDCFTEYTRVMKVFLGGRIVMRE